MAYSFAESSCSLKNAVSQQAKVHKYLNVKAESIVGRKVALFVCRYVDNFKNKVFSTFYFFENADRHRRNTGAFLVSDLELTAAEVLQNSTMGSNDRECTDI